MVLVQKWPFFRLYFLVQIGQENVFYDILKGKKRLSSLEKQQVQKVEKLRFFQRCKPLVLVKKLQFFKHFFVGNIGQKICFTTF